MTRSFWKGETAHIVEAMKQQPGLVEHWKAGVAEWAKKNRGNEHANAVNAWIELWQVREIYSAHELAPLWPALSIATGFREHWPAIQKSPARIEHELEFYGLPMRRIGGRKYFAIERRGHWRRAQTSEWEKEIGHAQH